MANLDIILRSLCGKLKATPINNAWFKHGKNPKKLVRLGLEQEVHNAFKVISPMQLFMDVEWLCGALKGALSFQSKSASLLMKSHAHKDRIKL